MVQQTQTKQLPKGWKDVPLEKLTTKITDGTHQTPNYVISGIPFFSVETVTNNTFTNTANATFQASSTAAFNVAGSWDNSVSATFTANQGTVTMDAGSGTPTITTGLYAFYNLIKFLVSFCCKIKSNIFFVNQL